MTIAEKYDGFIFDLDGTVYRGDILVPNAEVTINSLKENSKRLIFISNKTTGSIEEYCSILKNFGCNVNESEIVTSTVTIKKFLSENHAGNYFFAIGEEKFIGEICAAGLHYSEDPEVIQLVLVTLDRFICEEKIAIAAEALSRGAGFYAANIDMTCPVEGGEIVDAGTTIKELNRRTGRTLQDHFGKPSNYMMKEITGRMNVAKDKCLLIGDRLETDVAMANAFGIDSALVSTGVKYAPGEFAHIRPTYYFDSVFDILKNK